MGYAWSVKSYGTGQDHRSQFIRRCRVGSFMGVVVVLGWGMMVTTGSIDG
jgi:hypothetical protein